MIKIIKPGTSQTIECKNCGCVFSFDQEDIKVALDKKTKQESEWICSFYYLPERTIECPYCGINIVLEKTIK